MQKETFHVVAQSRATENVESARQLGKASIGVSIAGIVVTIVIIIIYVVVHFVFLKTATDALANCKFIIDGDCYRIKEAALGLNFCRGNGHYSSLDGFCYFK